MNEKKEMRKRLIKNTLFTLAIFILILLALDLIIYQRISSILYEPIDTEIKNEMNKLKIGLKERSLLDYMKKIKTNPRLICIIRDASRKSIK